VRKGGEGKEGRGGEGREEGKRKVVSQRRRVDATEMMVMCT